MVASDLTSLMTGCLYPTQKHTPVSFLNAEDLNCTHEWIFRLCGVQGHSTDFHITICKSMSRFLARSSSDSTAGISPAGTTV